MKRFLTKEEFDMVMEILNDKLTGKWDAIFGALADIKQEMTFTHGALERIEKRLDGVESEQASTRALLLQMDDRLSKVEDRLSKVEDRLSKVEDRLSKVEDRLSKVENRLSRIERDKLS